MKELLMKCRLCGNEKLIMRTDHLRRGEGVVWYCPSCDYALLLPPFENAKEYYDEEYRKKFSDILDGEEETPEQIYEMRKRYQDDRVDIIKKYYDSSKSFLEIGCSAGQFLNKIKTEFGRVSGIELSNSCAQFTRELVGCDVYTDPIEKVAKDTGKHWDYIGFFQVLEHIEDPVGFMNMVHDSLNEGGKVFIEIPTLDDPLRTVWNVPAYEEFFYHEAHLSYFTEKSIRILLEKCGFLVDDVFYYQDYNILNHLYWYFNNGPQGTCEFGLNKPNIDFLNEECGTQINQLFEEMNKRYFEILANHKKTSNFMVVASLK